MAVYCVDDGGDGSQDGATQTLTTLDWTKADVSFAALPAGALSTPGNTIYVGDDHGNPTTGANQELTGPSSGLPVNIISADRTQTTATYKKGTGNQVDSTDGAYNIKFNGTFALYGLYLNAGNAIIFEADDNEAFLTDNCTLKPGANSVVAMAAGPIQLGRHKDLTVDCANDTGASSSHILLTQNAGSIIEITGLTLSNVSNRTGVIFGSANTNGCFLVSGADLSAVPATVEILNNSNTNYANSVFNNCIIAATSVIAGIPNYTSVRATCYNIGAANAPTFNVVATGTGLLVSTTSIYRSSGASIESTSVGWNVTTSAGCSEGSPFCTDWIYGIIASTGSKTFDCYITNDTTDFDDDEVWLEVEFLGTTDKAIFDRATDQRILSGSYTSLSITSAAAAQTDDAASTWNGAGPSYTYKQKLSVTATVNVAGIYRARVCVAKASIASGDYFYIDPKITVS